MTDVRVITLNIHKGFTVGNRAFILDELRTELRASDADIVFLQEVIGEHKRHQSNIHDWPAKPQFEYLAETIWPHHVYGKNAIYEEGHHGNAILSHHPFKTTRNIDVSVSRASQRGILHGVIAGGIHLLCIHFGLFHGERRKQVNQLSFYVENKIPPKAPIILAGDFNDWRSRSDRVLTERLGLRDAYKSIHGKRAKTFPVLYPVLPVDRIYVRGCEINHCDILRGQHWSFFSDHCAIYADISV